MHRGTKNLSKRQIGDWNPCLSNASFGILKKYVRNWLKNKINWQINIYFKNFFGKRLVFLTHYLNFLNLQFGVPSKCRFKIEKFSPINFAAAVYSPMIIWEGSNKFSRILVSKNNGLYGIYSFLSVEKKTKAYVFPWKHTNFVQFK